VLIDALTGQIMAQELIPPATPCASQGGIGTDGKAQTVEHEFSLRAGWVRQATALGLAKDNQCLIVPVIPALASGAEGALGALLDALVGCPLPPQRIVIQIDEAPRIGETERNRALVQTFQTRGYGISISGFGDGFESLKELIHCPPGFIRLAPALTRDLCSDRFRRSIVGALVPVAEELGILLIADAVADVAQSEQLIELGIRLQQGPLHGVTVALAATPTPSN
jgi:EAL domain-containing protein (putative c-di-GMP-specific phosphodiesterase class I)